MCAVNYPARLWGISRFDKAKDAKRKCPFVKLVHTEIIGDVNKAQKEATQDTTSNGDTQESYSNAGFNASASWQSHQSSAHEVPEGELIEDNDARDYTAINLQSKVRMNCLFSAALVLSEKQ